MAVNGAERKPTGAAVCFRLCPTPAIHRSPEKGRSGGEPTFPICPAWDAQAEKQTFIHWRRGSRRGGGIGSTHRLADRQPQARQEQFAVLGITQVTGVRYYGRGNGA